MGFFATIKKFGNDLAEGIERQSQENERLAREKDRKEQELLNDYRSRGIYVLAVYVDGLLWNYFHYPSEDHRSEAATKFWPPFFSKLGISWRYSFIDPR